MISGQHVILMGAQGAGKGTQADLLAPELNLFHLSTGEAFRAEIGAQTELGVLAKAYLDRGDLVPDDVTLGIVVARLDQIEAVDGPDRKGGALFDGFPRTLSQAEGLAKHLEDRRESIAAVIEISVPRDVLIDRLSGRRVCPTCGTAYHIAFNPPAVAGICDRDGTPLEQREDDTPEAIARRLNLYAEMTAPVLEYYSNRGLLVTVDGRQPIADVHADILSAISARTAEGTR